MNETAYAAIAAEIHSDTSPVGIDAKKTHVRILQLLSGIEAQLGFDSAGQTDAEAIAAEIYSDSSPVGIDVKKTHVLIIHRLTQIKQHMESIA